MAECGYCGKCGGIWRMWSGVECGECVGVWRCVAERGGVWRGVASVVSVAEYRECIVELSVVSVAECGGVWRSVASVASVADCALKQLKQSWSYHNVLLYIDDKRFSRVYDMFCAAGDSLVTHRGFVFSTKDRYNGAFGGLPCVQGCAGGWWKTHHFFYNLNGQYGGGTHASGIVWYHWHGYEYSLKKVEMKLRP